MQSLPPVAPEITVVEVAEVDDWFCEQLHNRFDFGFGGALDIGGGIGYLNTGGGCGHAGMSLNGALSD